MLLKNWKRFCLLLIAGMIGFMTLTITGCSSETNDSSVSIDQICDRLIDELSYPEMANVSARYNYYYDLSDDLLQECRLYVCSSGAYPDELAVFQLKNSADLQTLEKAVQTRKEYLLETWKTYKPEEVPKIENSGLVSYAGFYFYIISENKEKASEVFDSLVG